MNKTKRLGLAGLALLSSLAVGVSGCKDYRVPVELPNSYQTRGIVEKSIDHSDIFSDEADLEEKSRVTGEISYLGFAKNEDNSVSVNNINQYATGRAQNNVTVYDNMGIIIKIKTSKQEYIFSLKTQYNILPPSIILEKFKKGDKVSIPTIRKYDGGGYFKIPLDNHFLSPTFGDGYKILNEIDYIYLEEIRKNN